eukprot:COSAG01_NODE_40823_length_456_cov_0.966667_1_plen_77_part_01
MAASRREHSCSARMLSAAASIVALSLAAASMVAGRDPHPPGRRVWLWLTLAQLVPSSHGLNVRRCVLCRTPTSAWGW